LTLFFRPVAPIQNPACAALPLMQGLRRLPKQFSRPLAQIWVLNPSTSHFGSIAVDS